MRLLITGAGGMLGQDVVRASQGHEVIALGHGDLDITDANAVNAAVSEADLVINCAAWTDVDGAEAAEGKAHEVNGAGAGNVARASRWIIHISSDYVFDGRKREPYLESDQVEPLSAYGRSKLAGERAVAEAAPDRHTIVRSSWLFGAGGACFPATILRLATERDELKVVDDQIGCPTFTGHLAHALLELSSAPPLGIVHVAGGGHCSWFDFASEIVSAARMECRVTPTSTAAIPRPATRPAYSVLGTERGPEVPRLPHWREGLSEYLRSAAPNAPLEQNSRTMLGSR